MTTAAGVGLEPTFAVVLGSAFALGAGFDAPFVGALVVALAGPLAEAFGSGFEAGLLPDFGAGFGVLLDAAGFLGADMAIMEKGR
jgi:hypothetical protein